MFLYWTDLELVGSDTKFDMVLPAYNRSAEFVSCFLSIPIFGSCEPHIYYYGLKGSKSEKIVLNRKQLMELVEEPGRPIVYIDINCQIIDALPKKVQKVLYQLSETRTPHEPEYGNVEHPCMKPIEYHSGTRGNMTVTLTIMPPGTKRRWYTDKSAVLKGYVHHEELLTKAQPDYPCFSLNAGPGFCYEYAIYIMEYLREHFLGLGTAGGVGTDGKWTDGFSYTNSLYKYERIQLPIRIGIEHTLKRLWDCDIIRSYQNYYQDGWKYDQIKQFRMVNLPEEYPRSERIFFFSEYVNYIEWVLRQNWEVYKTICATAVHIMLPKPEHYKNNLEMVSHLNQRLEDVTDTHNDSHFCGYLSFLNINDQLVGEFRIPWYMKEYLLMLLDLKDSGKIDQMRAPMYRRHLME